MPEPTTSDNSSTTLNISSTTSDNPSFTCSGELLWGQLHCIAEGFLTDNSITDTQSHIPVALQGGTIIQRNHKYRVKAAIGEWHVREIYSRSDEENLPFHLGFVVYNSNLADPVDILKRCAKVGISNKQDHDDKAIVYVNRYDWSWTHAIPERAKQIVYADLDDNTKEEIEGMMGNRLIMVDAAAGLAVIEQLKLNRPDRLREEMLKETLKVKNQPIGVHLACLDTEYELGWMVFNQEELIAFVYDGAYTALEGELFLNDGRCIRSLEEWLAELDVRKKASEEFWTKHYLDLEAKDVEDLAAIFNDRNSKTATQVAEELLQRNYVNLSITSELLDPYRHIHDLQEIFDILGEKKKTLHK